jgi:hypothetical protein
MRLGFGTVMRGSVGIQICVETKTDGTLKHYNEWPPISSLTRVCQHALRAHTNWQWQGGRQTKTADSLRLKEFLVRTRQKLVNTCQFLAAIHNLTGPGNKLDRARALCQLGPTPAAHSADHPPASARAAGVAAQQAVAAHAVGQKKRGHAARALLRTLFGLVWAASCLAFASLMTLC